MHMFDYKNFCDRHLDIITLKMRIFYAVTLFLITLFTNTPFVIFINKKVKQNSTTVTNRMCQCQCVWWGGPLEKSLGGGGGKQK